MNTIAAVTTPKGIAAISSIELAGADSPGIIHKIFVPAGPKQFDLIPGSIFTGRIIDNDSTIDHVVLGCLDVHDFEINCHGNPLIIEKVMKLLAVNGAKLVSADDLLLTKLQNDPSKNAIEVEAAIAEKKASTLLGVELITNQTPTGLAAVAAGWMGDIDRTPLDTIKNTCIRILDDSKAARFLTGRVKAVIAGPPNSGKSTLLNALAGRQKAIVTDIAGTTRDWVSTIIRTDDMLIEFFDTAGLDNALVSDSQTDAASQASAGKLLAQSDIVLLVLDSSSRPNLTSINFPKGKKLILVWNKSDIGKGCDVDIVADATVSISAQNSAGIDKLLNAIHSAIGINGFDVKTPVCFTTRQIELLQQLINTDDKAFAKTLISQLIIGPVSV